MKPIQITFSEPIKCWQGEWGNYVIPYEFEDVRIRRNGWPDKRSAKYEKFVAWAKEMDRAVAAKEMIGIPIKIGL